ncbi:hypothetical protein D3C81_1938410 [compost metagenome]
MLQLQNGPEHGQPVHPRHTDIRDHNVGLFFLNQLQTVLSVSSCTRKADPLRLPLHGLQAFHNGTGVIHNTDADFLPLKHRFLPP